MIDTICLVLWYDRISLVLDLYKVGEHDRYASAYLAWH
jgi:hypothetical protein